MMFDLHIHSVFSDGELIPSEIARRCEFLGYKAIAITDHADFSNIEFILKNVLKACEELNRVMDIEVIPGIEITHVPPRKIPDLAKTARKLGAKLVVVHGESMVEPVAEGTNRYALESNIDILAHPGLISIEEAYMAKENNIYLELTVRRGHCLANGHVARVAKEAGAELIVSTDAHSPSDLVKPDFLKKVCIGSGLNERDTEIITTVNPKRLLEEL